jgi:C-terminal processing protease CtpA/Prc
MGAVFTPPGLQGDDLVARVVDGSPAHEAGIRNADVLLRVGELDATKWRTDPAVNPFTRNDSGAGQGFPQLKLAPWL